MSELLSLPVSRAVRHLAQGYLDDAQQAYQRFIAGDDPEALHDFRVALRRLRSLVGTYKPYIKDCLPKKQRQRIKDIAAATGLARDTEVQLQWLHPRLTQAKEHEAAGFAWMVQRLQARLAEEYADLHNTLPPSFNRLHERLGKRLGLEYEEHSAAFGQVAHELIGTCAEAFRQHLDGVCCESDGEQIHQARIIGKRLRYLIEPLAKADAAYKPLLKELKTLQDLMGEFHDAQVFAEELTWAAEEAGALHLRQVIELSLTRPPEDPQIAALQRADERAGLMTLARDLQERREDLMSRLLNRLRDGALQAFYAHLHTLSPPQAIEHTSTR
ncbi:CHAD domain-containing protein [Thiorhodospira sibirica]|uniref:CHAD domain-containing protein n=1 Tax=Thiorhodospira sibirica TaxID=154347 RepID=UPI00022C0B28|nr:CHAD domain-containing protein [Thiorhodospira sibirica]